MVGIDSTTLIDVLQNSHRMPPPLARPAFALPDKPDEPSSYSFATDGTEILVTSPYRLLVVLFSDADLNVFRSNFDSPNTASSFAARYKLVEKSLCNRLTLSRPENDIIRTVDGSARLP